MMAQMSMACEVKLQRSKLQKESAQSRQQEVELHAVYAQAFNISLPVSEELRK